MADWRKDKGWGDVFASAGSSSLKYALMGFSGQGDAALVGGAQTADRVVTDDPALAGVRDNMGRSFAPVNIKVNGKDMQVAVRTVCAGQIMQAALAAGLTTAFGSGTAYVLQDVSKDIVPTPHYFSDDIVDLYSGMEFTLHKICHSGVDVPFEELEQEARKQTEMLNATQNLVDAGLGMEPRPQLPADFALAMDKALAAASGGKDINEVLNDIAKSADLGSDADDDDGGGVSDEAVEALRAAYKRKREREEQAAKARMEERVREEQTEDLDRQGGVMLPKELARELWEQGKRYVKMGGKLHALPKPAAPECAGGADEPESEAAAEVSLDEAFDKAVDALLQDDSKGFDEWVGRAGASARAELGRAA